MAFSGSFGINPKKSYGTVGLSTQPIVQHKLGDRASNPQGEWIYGQAKGAVAQYAFVLIDPSNWDMDELETTNDGTTFGQVAVYQGAALADDEQGWFWLGKGGGTGVGIYGKVAASYVALANLNTTATGGVADDSSTVEIENVIGMTTDAGSASSIELFAGDYMYVNAS